MTSKPAVLTATLLALVAAAPASAQSGPPTDITPVVQPAYATYGIWTGPFTGKPSKFDASVQNTTAAKGDFAYTWTSSDGTVPVPVATDPTGATVEFTFPTTGPREVTVSVTGPNGFADTFTSTVEVKDEPPQPNYDGWKPAVTVTNVTTTANVAPHPYAPIPVRPAPVAEPAVAPVARFGKLATKVARNGRLAVPVSCDAVAGDACSAQVVVRTARPVKLGGGKGKAKVAEVGKAAVVVPELGVRPATVTLSAPARALLARVKRLPVVVEATVTDAPGRRTVVSRKLTLTSVR